MQAGNLTTNEKIKRYIILPESRATKTVTW